MPLCPQKLDYGNVYAIKMKSLVETFFFWGLETEFACKTNNTRVCAILQLCLHLLKSGFLFKEIEKLIDPYHVSIQKNDP